MSQALGRFPKLSLGFINYSNIDIFAVQRKILTRNCLIFSLGATKTYAGATKISLTRVYIRAREGGSDRDGRSWESFQPVRLKQSRRDVFGLKERVTAHMQGCNPCMTVVDTQKHGPLQGFHPCLYSVAPSGLCCAVLCAGVSPLPVFRRPFRALLRRPLRRGYTPACILSSLRDFGCRIVR